MWLAVAATSPSCSEATIELVSTTSSDFTSSYTQTLSVTVPDGLDQVLFVCVQTQAASASSITASYAGLPMTLAAQRFGGLGTAGAAIFYLVDPPVGTANISATTNGTASPSTNIGAWLLSGVSESAPVEDTETGETTFGSTASATVTTVTANAMVLACGYSSGTSNTMGGDLDTEDWTQTGLVSTEGAGGRTNLVGTPGNQTATYTTGVASGIIVAAVVVKPAPDPSDRLTFILDDSCTSGVGPCFEEASPTSGNPFVSANTDQIVLQNESMRLSNKTLDLTNVVPILFAQGCANTASASVACGPSRDSTASIATLSATEDGSWAWPYNVRCTNLWANSSGGSGSGTWTVRFIKNGTEQTGASDPAITLLPDEGPAQRDSARYIDFNAGDTWGVFFTEVGTVSGADIGYGVECYKR